MYGGRCAPACSVRSVGHPARVTDLALPPYVEARDFIRVRALVRGKQRGGFVIGWRGERVYLQWRSDMGNHLGWVPAKDVMRV